VDGVMKGTLDEGVAHIDVPEGAHAVSVRVPGFEAPALPIKVKAGSEQEVGFALVPAKEGSSSPAAATESTESHALPTREILGYAALAAGAGFLTGATIEGLNWLADKNASDNDRKSIPSTVTDVCVNPTTGPELDACAKSRDASSRSTLGWIFLGAGAALGATGVWLITSDHSSTDTSKARGPHFAVVPLLAPHAGAVDLEGNF